MELTKKEKEVLRDILRTEIIEVEDMIKDDEDNYNKLVSMKNDSQFGTFIFCSSEKAADDAGIVIVDVKVNLKNNININFN